MDDIISALPKFGIVGALVGVIVSVMWYMIRKDAEATKRREEATSNLIGEMTSSLITHNERAGENHRVMLSNFALVLRDHEKMLEHTAKIMMAISLQDKVIDGFERSVSEMKCTLQAIKDNTHDLQKMSR